MPPYNFEQCRYNLRNTHNIKVPFSRLEILKRSFFPRTARLWNSLDSIIRDANSLNEFKRLLKKQSPEAKVLYFYGKRWPSIHHSRIRMGCSALGHDLCFRMHVSHDPSCACGVPDETAFHFFLQCPRYNRIRENMLATIESICPCTLDTILYGDDNISEVKNRTIFEAVHNFICDSKRFSWMLISCLVHVTLPSHTPRHHFKDNHKIFI